MKHRLAVIGCGNMGSAIVRGLLASGWATPDQILVTHPSATKAAQLTQQLGVQSMTDNAAATKHADIVLLGVKPQIIKGALRELREVVKQQLVLSIAAGISTRFIEYYFPKAPVVRCMPNLAVTVGAGASAMCGGQHTDSEHLAQARAIFEAVGTVELVHENLMDAVTGLSGTGPMYVFHLIEAMADAGVKVGLPRDVAMRLSMQTVHGSAKLAQASDAHPAALKDQVTSPGGTAIAALHVLRKAGFSAVVMDAVEAARDRSAQLGE